MEFQSGQMLAHYRLEDKIGEGGMGVVWRAVDATLDREAAIKILPEAFALRVTLDDQRLRSGSLALSPDGQNLVVQVQRSDGTTVGSAAGSPGSARGSSGSP